jgi:hypothetical protein
VNKERDAAFTSYDTNNNDMLDLDEYLKFCYHAGEMLTNRIGETFVCVDEESMKQQWNLNRHEGKSGITLSDFHKKLEIDSRLMKWKKEEALLKKSEVEDEKNDSEEKKEEEVVNVEHEKKEEEIANEEHEKKEEEVVNEEEHHEKEEEVVNEEEHHEKEHKSESSSSSSDKEDDEA